MKNNHMQEAVDNNMKEAADKNEKMLKNSRIRNCIRTTVLLHPILLAVIITVVLFLFALLFCWISVGIDMGRMVGPKESVTYLYSEWSIETGLSLLSGYSGMGATVVLGLITLRYTFKTDERERIEQLQNVTIESVHFYNMHENFVPSKLRHADTKECQFLLEIKLKGGISGYQLKINKVWWGDCNAEYENINKKGLYNLKAYVENAANVTIYMYFDEFEFIHNPAEQGDNTSGISFFYHIRDYEPLLLEKYMRYRWIQMDMHTQEKVWSEKQRSEQFAVEFKILVENRNYREEKKEWIELNEVEHGFKIMDTRGKQHDIRG